MSDKMIIAIGNAPSSGSTFLADLMDSLPFAICGPEIGLFSSSTYFTAFEQLKRDRRITSSIPAIYLNRQRLLTEYLWAYGFDADTTKSLFCESDTFIDFCDRMFRAFAAFRKKECSLYCEKTPQNIHCAQQFLDMFENGYFIHIVRDPLFVYKSLARRNFPPYIAANTWLVEVSQAYRLKDHPRFIEINYETLAERPFDTISALLKKIGIDFPPACIQTLYRENRYRKEFTQKLDAWEIKDYGVIKSANRKSVDESDINALRYMLQTKISARYAGMFALKPMQFQALINHFGYDYTHFEPHLNRLHPGHHVDFKSNIRSLRKFIGDLQAKDCRLTDIFAYLKPVGTQPCAA